MLKTEGVGVERSGWWVGRGLGCQVHAGRYREKKTSVCAASLTTDAEGRRRGSESVANGPDWLRAQREKKKFHLHKPANHSFLHARQVLSATVKMSTRLSLDSLSLD